MPRNEMFSRAVSAVILVSQNIGTVAMFLLQTLYLHKFRLLSINLRGSWPSERSHSVSQVNLPVQMSVEIITT